ncbi:MAG TPA: hypothetical protein VJS17_11460 [Pyrinomonadaceae bacterium]|nr:hypothetical protein [Pyrinomonadaceae bacterium]
MSAQSQKMQPDESPVTPVIIKSGGGGGDPTQTPTQPPTETSVVFNAMGKVFDSPLTDERWQVAKSSGPASIMSVQIQDGPNSYGPFDCNDGEELVVLEVTYGTDTLVVNELRIHNDLLNTEIAITSPLVFKVMDAGEREDQWIEAKAWYPIVPPLVVLTKGGRQLAKQQCEFLDVTITLICDWGGKVA